MSDDKAAKGADDRRRSDVPEDDEFGVRIYRR
jgi:hypothetical protein